MHTVCGDVPVKHYAFVTRLIRWRMAVLFDIGQRVELVNTDRAGSWLVMGTDYRGHDRMTWVRPSWLVCDPHPDLHMEDA